MRITRLRSDLLRLPFDRPSRLALNEAVPAPPAGLFVLLVHVDTDSGLAGVGFATAFAGGQALRSIVVDELAPRLAGQDPLDHERLTARIRHEITNGETLLAAHATVDIALWDLKGKAAGQPLYKLLGGCRDAAVAHAADTAWPWLTADAVLEIAEPLTEQGIRGLSVSLGGRDAQADAHKLQRVRDAVGEQIWFGVHGRQAYDVGTALALGRFLEEELDADWFEDPIAIADNDGYARLAEKLEVPIAAGGQLGSAADFRHLLTANALGIARPDVLRLGGITPWLRVAGLVEAFHRPIVPHLLPEVGVHLACGRAGVQAVEHVSWLEPLWRDPPRLHDGMLTPPPGPGLGLEPDSDAVARYSV